ncbi:MAG: DNA replication and repair protein RecF [Vampirovibrionales bacterium]|nr:DNA replication and repair protein RecF [Vampirovibrionales bacterium]
MKLERLYLQAFRNYEEQTLILSPEKNLFIGQNGQGKTNLLEAIYILSHTQSNRTHQEKELMRLKEEKLGSGREEALCTTILGDIIETDGDKRTLEVQYYRQILAQGIMEASPLSALSAGRLKTRFKQNGVLLKSRSQFLGYLPSVSFFLSDLLLLRGAPEERRRWLDAAITQIDKGHLAIVSHYQKIKTQKSRLLKEPYGSVSEAHLEVWNLQLATAAAKLCAARLLYLSKIETLTSAHYAELSGGDAALSFSYQAAVLEGIQEAKALNTLVFDEKTLEDAYLNLLERRKMDELRRGTCLVGPHRDDIAFYLGGLEAQRFGSQGQQRTIVLALKLSELCLLRQTRQLQPILLLDDVMAELDLSRQQFLIQHLNADTQVLMTTTHMDQSWHRLFKSQEEEVFEVVSGKVLPYATRALSL